MNINIFVKFQTKLMLILFFSQLFSFISFFSIKTLSVTIPFLIAIMYLIYSLIGFLCNRILIKKRRIVFALLLLLFLLLSCFIPGFPPNFLSLMLYIFYFSLFFLTDERMKIKDMDKIITCFSKIITIFSVYGIYQFIAYNFATWLPLKELIPDFLTAANFNTIQSTRIVVFGLNLIKPHSIFDEASSFSRYCSIATLFLTYIILFNKCKNNKEYIKNVLLLSINLICLVLTLSGSGIIIFIAGLLILFYKANINKKLLFLILLSAISFAIFIFTINDNSLLNFYLQRLSEFNNENTSAYLRFVLPIKIGLDGICKHFFGYGVGNDDIAYAIFNANENSIANGFGKIFVEMGLNGVLIIIILYLFIFPYNRILRKNLLYNLLFIITVVLSFVSSILDASFFAFIIMTFGYKNYLLEKEISINAKSIVIHG